MRTHENLRIFYVLKLWGTPISLHLSLTRRQSCHFFFFFTSTCAFVFLPRVTLHLKKNEFYMIRNVTNMFILLFFCGDLLITMCDDNIDVLVGLCMTFFREKICNMSFQQLNHGTQTYDNFRIIILTLFN